jgi:choline kinase
MRAIILAAGVGRRLGGKGDLPKCLLKFSEKTLLQRHLEFLKQCGIEKTTIAVGYKKEAIQSEIEKLKMNDFVDTVFNPDFEQGSVLSLWSTRDQATYGGDILLMDADVLFGLPLLSRLVETKYASSFLMDKDFEPGGEPVKLCIRDGKIVEFRKTVEVEFDTCGESVGFFKFSSDTAKKLIETTERFKTNTEECYEEPLRDLALNSPPDTFGVEDITGMPWTEIDFPKDVRKAEEKIFTQLEF